MRKKRDWLSLSYVGKDVPLEEDGFDYVTALKPKSDSFIDSSPSYFPNTELDPVHLFNRSIIVQVDKDNFVSNLSFFHNKSTMSKIYYQNQNSFYKQKNKNASFSIDELNKRKKMYARMNNKMESHMSEINELTQMFKKNLKNKKNYFRELFNIDSKTLSFHAVDKVINVMQNRNIRFKKRLTKYRLHKKAFNKVIPKIKSTIEEKTNTANNEIIDLSNQLQLQNQELDGVNEIISEYQKKEKHIREIIQKKDYILINSEQTEHIIKRQKKQCIDHSKNIEQQLQTVSLIKQRLVNQHNAIIKAHEDNVKRMHEKYDQLVNERKEISKQYEECKAQIEEINEELGEQNDKIYSITKLISYKEKMASFEEELTNMNQEHETKMNNISDDDNKLEYQYEQAKVSSHLKVFIDQVEDVNKAKEKVLFASKVVRDEKQETIEKIKVIKQEIEDVFCSQVNEIRPELSNKIKSRNAVGLEKELYNIAVERKQFYYDTKAATRKMKKKVQSLSNQIKQHKINIVNKKDDLEELLFRQEFETLFDLTEEERSSLYRMFWLIKSIRNEMPLWLNKYNNDHVSLARAWAFHLDKIAKLKPKN